MKKKSKKYKKRRKYINKKIIGGKEDENDPVLQSKCNPGLQNHTDHTVPLEEKSHAAPPEGVNFSQFEQGNNVSLKNYFDMLSLQPSNVPSTTSTLPLSKTLTDLWFDEMIISIMEEYIKRLPVARNYPSISSSTPKHTDVEGDSIKSKTFFFEISIMIRN